MERILSQATLVSLGTKAVSSTAVYQPAYEGAYQNTHASQANETVDNIIDRLLDM